MAVEGVKTLHLLESQDRRHSVAGRAGAADRRIAE
jgi:hypothetical protein